MVVNTKGRPQSTNIEDHRPDDLFFMESTPPFKPAAADVNAAKASGVSQAAMDDATSILNEMQTELRMQERSWVAGRNLNDRVSQKDVYITWKQDLIDKQNNNNNQFLLDTFKRARSVGYPIHPLVPMLSSLGNRFSKDQ